MDEDRLSSILCASRPPSLRIHMFKIPRRAARRGLVIAGALTLAVASAALSLGPAAHHASAAVTPAALGPLVWADDFNGAAGSAPDASRWGHETGGGGFGDNELEC